MAYTSAIPQSGVSLISRIRAAIAAFSTARAQAAAFNRSYSELQGLSDRELKDIGVRRCDIADRARAHVYCR